jgi:hypothetical protein
MDHATAEDAFNLLCHTKLGSGIHRDVFECRIDPKLVVKVETDLPWRFFANVFEMKLWNENQHCDAVAKWLAPCEYLSPDGLLLLQRRVEPLRDSDKLPDKLPSFLTDIKRENFGLLDGRIVACDYALNIANSSTRLKRAPWNE